MYLSENIGATSPQSHHGSCAYITIKITANSMPMAVQACYLMFTVCIQEITHSGGFVIAGWWPILS